MEITFLRSPDYDRLLNQVLSENIDPLLWFNDLYNQNKERNPDFLRLFQNSIERKETKIFERMNNLSLLNPEMTNDELHNSDPEFNKIWNIKEQILKILNSNPNNNTQPIKPKIKGESILNRVHTTLLYWYFREVGIIPKNTDNREIARVLFSLYGYAIKQSEEILTDEGNKLKKFGKEGNQVDYKDLKILKSVLETLFVRINEDQQKISEYKK